MPLLAILLAALVLLAACSTSGERTLRFFVNIPALICVLTPIIGYVICKGFKPFGKGLSAMLRLPQQEQPEVADYFQKLIMAVCGVGIVLSFILSVLSVYPFFDLEIRKQMLLTAILSFFYTGWLTLLVFVPIAHRLSGGNLNTKLRVNFANWAFLAVIVLFPVFTSACINYKRSNPLDVIQQFTSSLPSDYKILQGFFDVPTIFVLLATLTACRLGLGKLQNRYDWIVISVFVGVFWTLQGWVAVLSNMGQPDITPDFFATGCAVALLSVVYGISFALPVLLNFGWFFTLWAVLFCVSICAVEFRHEGIPIDSPFDGFNIIPTAIQFFVLCIFGRFCDMIFLTITRYESFTDMFRKHYIFWIMIWIPIVVIVWWWGSSLVMRMLAGS